MLGHGRWARSLGAAVVLAALPGAAQSELSFEAGVRSETLRRGYSMTDHRPGLLLDAQWGGSRGWLGGLLISTVELDVPDSGQDAGEVELRARFGRSFEWSPTWSSALTLTRYQLPGASSDADISYSEGSWSTVWRDEHLFGVSFSTDYLGSSLQGVFVEWTSKLPLGRRLELEIGAGAADLERGVEYEYGHVGILRDWGSFTADLGIFLSNAPEIPRWGTAFGARLAVGLAYRFP